MSYTCGNVFLEQNWKKKKITLDLGVTTTLNMRRKNKSNKLLQV